MKLTSTSSPTACTSSACPRHVPHQTGPRGRRGPDGRVLCGTQIYGAFDDLHAIDATLDGVTVSVPHRSTDPARDTLVDFHTGVVSNRSFAKLAALEPDAVLLSGDLSYADGWPWRWDSRGRGVPPSSN